MAEETAIAQQTRGGGGMGWALFGFGLGFVVAVATAKRWKKFFAWGQEAPAGSGIPMPPPGESVTVSRGTFAAGGGAAGTEAP